MDRSDMMGNSNSGLFDSGSITWRASINRFAKQGTSRTLLCSSVLHPLQKASDGVWKSFTPIQVLMAENWNYCGVGVSVGDKWFLSPSPSQGSSGAEEFVVSGHV